MAVFLLVATVVYLSMSIGAGPARRVVETSSIAKGRAAENESPAGDLDLVLPVEERRNSVPEIEDVAKASSRVDRAVVLGGRSPETRLAVTQAINAECLRDDDLAWLLEDGAMRDFLSAWEAESARVNVARAERINRGKEIAKKRFSGGRYTETILDEQERQSDGGFDTSAFMKLAHEDEWVSVKLVERPEGGQSIRSVRIMPGEERELDRVTSVLRATEAARAAAVAAVARNYR